MIVVVAAFALELDLSSLFEILYLVLLFWTFPHNVSFWYLILVLILGIFVAVRELTK
jgi:hypothetical protein